jgi:divalent metal cation (Fe/Co/Zn/Cd) transporter
MGRLRASDAPSNGGIGLVANVALGWWWADPLAALAIIPLAVREGLESSSGANLAADA